MKIALIEVENIVKYCRISINLIKKVVDDPCKDASEIDMNNFMRINLIQNNLIQLCLAK